MSNWKEKIEIYTIKYVYAKKLHATDFNLEMKRCSNTTNQRVVCMLGHHVAQNTIIEYISTFVRL